MKKAITILLSLLMLGAVGFGVWRSYHAKQNPGAQSAAPLGDLIPQKAVPQQTVKLLTGSAKFALLQDAELSALLRKNGITLELKKSGNFEQDKSLVEQLDAVWPAGANQAADWQELIAGNKAFLVMSSPLTIASWRALLPVLEKNGLAKSTGNAHGDFYLDKALPLMLEGKRWNQLQDNTVFAVNRSFLINTPDIRKSNTAAQYIAALAYIRNNSEVPQKREKALELAKELAPLITRQGFQEGTLAGPFEDYLGQGMGKAPMVLVYESQFLEARRAQKLRDAHLLYYPQPGMVLKHILVAKTEGGKKLGELLANNIEIQKIIAKYGFRTNDPALFAAQAKELGLDAPEILNQADAPGSAILDAMVQHIIDTMENRS
ncbi:hypothetical protein V8J88_17360 [Massilia sp. W12]|uniref:hypothetical protein n=1 Tax=Massilia sp. W12 TaxID=3126507 RepID=UPI0030D2D5D2